MVEKTKVCQLLPAEAPASDGARHPLLKENGCIVYEFSRRNIPMEGVTICLSM